MTPVVVCKWVRKTQMGENDNHLKMIFSWSSTKLTNRNGLMLLYFNRELLDPFFRKNTTGQYYCEPDLEIEVYL